MLVHCEGGGGSTSPIPRGEVQIYNIAIKPPLSTQISSFQINNVVCMGCGKLSLFWKRSKKGVGGGYRYTDVWVLNCNFEILSLSQIKFGSLSISIELKVLSINIKMKSIIIKE